MRYLIFISIILLPVFLYRSSRHKGKEIIKLSDPDTSYYNGFKRLDLSQSNLTQLPIDIANYKNIEELDLSNNPITKLDIPIIQLKKLRTLKLNDCPNIDPENVISLVKSLHIENLEMRNSFLTYLPYSLSECSSIKSLDLNGNYIQHFPEELALNGRLQKLDIGNNKIDTLPDLFNAMIWLKYLDVSNNPCLEVPKVCRVISGLHNLEVLKMNGAREITGDLNEMDNLKVLDLAGSRIKEFPDKFHIPSLRSLNIKDCEQLDYENLAHSLEQLDSLEEIDLASGKLNKIGDELTKIHSLTSISIGTNSLKDLPDMQKFSRLRKVAIQLNDENIASHVFDRLSKCKELEELDVSFSTLHNLPSSVSHLKGLKRLNIEGLNLTTYPSSLAEMNKLTELNLKGNAIETGKLEILTKKLDNCNIILDDPYSVPAGIQAELAATKESFTVNVANTNTITTVDGTEIKIPANAFVDKNGKPVKGNVEVSFQPYYTPTQIIMSGISMNYDSAGKRNSFITAGMFNITAKSGGNELSLNSQKKIQVDFKSNDPGNNYNYYNYNPTTRNWNYKGRNDIKVPARDKKVVLKPINYKDKIKRMNRPYMHTYMFGQLPTEIYHETVETKGRRKYTFWIKRGYKDASVTDEINGYFSSGNSWVYEPDSNEYHFFKHIKGKYGSFFYQEKTAHLFRKNYYYMRSEVGGDIAIEVRPDQNKDRFLIIFKSRNDSMTLTGYPEYSGMPNKVQERTKKEYEQYLEAKKIRERQQDELMTKYRAELSIYEEKMKEYREYLKSMNAEELSQINNKPVTGDRITRTLMLDQLGTWNCDIINRLPNGVEIYVRLFDDKGKRVTPKSLTLVDRTNNGFGSFGTMKIVCDRFVNNVILAKVDGEKYGYAKFRVDEKNIATLDLTLTVLNTKSMTMKEFNDQVFN